MVPSLPLVTVFTSYNKHILLYHFLSIAFLMFHLRITFLKKNAMLLKCIYFPFNYYYYFKMESHYAALVGLKLTM